VNEADLPGIRKRLKTNGLHVTPIVFHSDGDPSGFTRGKDANTSWISISFPGPDGEFIELTAQVKADLSPEADVKHLPRSSTDRDHNRQGGTALQIPGSRVNAN